MDKRRIMVLERGTTLTHELTLACRGSAIEVLGPVHELANVVDALRQATVDVVVVEQRGVHDPWLPDAIRKLPQARVLAMAETTDPAMTAVLVSLGAAGVIQRGAEKRVLADALRRAAAGELIAPAAHLPTLLEMIGLSRGSDEPASRMRTLTGRERQVLGLLADGRTSSDIAAELHISGLTVQSHVKNILAKLGVHSKVEAIRCAWRSGLFEIPIGA
jgi:DNA-binding NarL/FixJ family response regulator